MANDAPKDKETRRPPHLEAVPEPPPKPTVIVTDRLPAWVQVVASIATTITALATTALVVATLLLFYGARREYQHYREEYQDFKLQRQLDLMDKHLDRFHSPLMLHARGSAAGSIGEGSALQLLVFQFFERMGIQAREGLVTPAAVRDHFSVIPQFYWCGWRDWVKHRRELTGNPDIWIEFENLNKSIGKLTGRECISEAEIQEYAGFELAITQEYLSKLSENKSTTP